MSETLAARTGCYDLVNRCWSAEALAFAGAPPLPRLLKTGEVAGTAGPGRLRDAGVVSPDTLIVAGGHDHPIASSADPAAQRRGADRLPRHGQCHLWRDARRLIR